MKKKKDEIIESLLLFQMVDCNVSYSQRSKKYDGGSFMYDTIAVNCRVLRSNYSGAKVDKIIEIIFNIDPDVENNIHFQKSLGYFDTISRKPFFYILVSPKFPNRLDFILNRGIKPYFVLDCEREKRQKPMVKTFHMINEIVPEDYGF